jgi:ATP-dependent Clp protease adapter protein ClpS
MDKRLILFARFAGAILLAFGILLAAFAIWMLRHLIPVFHALAMDVVVAGVFFLSLITFCCLAGYRLLFNRPTPNGSLLTPTAWLSLSFCCLIAAAIALGKDEPLLLLAAAGWGVFCIMSFFAGRAGSRKGALSPVFPPGTALLQIEEFVPVGFSSGIEIMNDNLTPMAFVVSVLHTCIGMSEPCALRTMLEIHTKGGTLLPLSSFEEAKRVAEAVAEKARTSNYPLVCRAVRVE